MSANEHDDDQPDSFEVVERLRSQLAAIREQTLAECEAIARAYAYDLAEGAESEALLRVADAIAARSLSTSASAICSSNFCGR